MPAIARSWLDAALSVATSAGSVGQRILAGQAAEIDRAVRTRKKLRRVAHTIFGLDVREQRLSRNRGGGAEHDAVAFQTIDVGNRQPAAGERRPWPHRDHHGIRLHLSAVDVDPTDSRAIRSSTISVTSPITHSAPRKRRVRPCLA